MASRTEFEVVSDTEVKHKPTGATFATARFDDMEPMKGNFALRVRWGTAGERIGGREHPPPRVLEPIARALLRELARNRLSLRKPPPLRATTPSQKSPALSLVPPKKDGA